MQVTAEEAIPLAGLQQATRLRVSLSRARHPRGWYTMSISICTPCPHLDMNYACMFQQPSNWIIGVLQCAQTVRVINMRTQPFRSAATSWLTTDLT